MPLKAKYVHTNLIAEDWKELSDFYQKVFGCIVVPPERDLKGKALEDGTGINGAHLKGVHLRLPGYNDSGPTLEIFSYEPCATKSIHPVNKSGYTHIAFLVDDVEQAKEIVIKNGGKEIGSTVTITISDGSNIKWCYVTDPENNIIELQTKIQL